MNDKTRRNGYRLGMILFVTAGIIIFVILRILHPSLVSHPSKMVTSWLKTPDCEMPCWENINPGKTTRDQAKSLLQSNPDTKIVDESEVIPFGLMLFVEFQEDNDKARVSIGFDKNNIVQSINLPTSGQSLYVDDIISYYGPPQYVVLYWNETVGADVDLVYPQKGLVINFYWMEAHFINEEEMAFGVYPDQEVSGIDFYVPNLEYYYSFAWQPLKRYDWKGFTSYP